MKTADIVYVDNIGGGAYIEDPMMTYWYNRAFERLVKTAWGPPRSAEFLAALEEELRKPKKRMTVDADWRKSSLSDGNGCLEMAVVNGRIAVRDSKDPEGPVLMFSPPEWTAFIKGAHNGEFDLRDEPAAPALDMSMRPSLLKSQRSL